MDLTISYDIDLGYHDRMFRKQVYEFKYTSETTNKSSFPPYIHVQKSITVALKNVMVNCKS